MFFRLKVLQFPPTFNAPIWPHVSHPIANPEIILKPLFANSLEIYVPPATPSGVTSLVPITAKPGFYGF